jgi:hypothetical protein
LQQNQAIKLNNNIGEKMKKDLTRFLTDIIKIIIKTIELGLTSFFVIPLHFRRSSDWMDQHEDAAEEIKSLYEFVIGYIIYPLSGYMIGTIYFVVLPFILASGLDNHNLIIQVLSIIFILLNGTSGIYELYRWYYKNHAKTCHRIL